MPQSAALLVTATIVTLMFSLGLGLKDYPFMLLRDRPGFLWRVVIGTCLLVPLAGLVLVLLPLQGVLTRPAWAAMALMLVCPSAPLILFRVRGSGGTAELAARLQIAAALLAILTIPLMAVVFKASVALNGWEIDGWEINPAQVAMQVLQVQVLPVIAGVLLGQWKPQLAQRCSRALGALATLMLMLMLVALLVLSGSQLVPFLQQNLLALAAMAGLCVFSLAIGYGLAGRDPLERRTVALVTGMRNTGLAAQLALTYQPGMPELIPGILSYVLITVIISTLFLKWQQREITGVA
ncbi:sodium dependent transporter [Synechococcus sp. BSF8S]|uniref:bile acid:sodium symporter family protein n=1 Tax=Synechococcales TaxID=1890424 RepID=UPI001628FFA7|nr:MULTISPECIES: sodium dependent transporter [unclassified Synechococcus]MBC1259957.1 sodium dependent transporter [Synechococcus sp. BSF8S]MBC1262620.1 sodium dependent transporter [Synechococcus sp. BSA11S]